MGKSEDRLHKRLRKTERTKDNDTAVKGVFKAFADYYGEKADESHKKAKQALVMVFLAFGLFLVIAFSML